MDPEQLGSSRLNAERSLHLFERRLEQELKDQYHYFMRKSKGLDHRDPVNSQEGTKHDTVYQLSSLQEIYCTTTLGLLRNPKIDNFKSRITPHRCNKETNSTANTKRRVLATTALIFVSVGLLSQAVIAYKLFLQKLWQDRLQCDEQLPAHLKQEWNQLLQTIPKLSQLKINRNVTCSNAVNIQIHGFCDSSQRAYVACLYIRSTDNTNKIFCELLCSTSKVAPQKQLTIPRLELSAGTLLSKLYKKAIGALKLTINESYIWTDTSIVLTWIQGPPNKWKTFVGNRDDLIQEETASAS